MAMKPNEIYMMATSSKIPIGGNSAPVEGWYVTKFDTETQKIQWTRAMLEIYEMECLCVSAYYDDN